MSKHTPGPWIVRGREVIGPQDSGVIVARIPEWGILADGPDPSPSDARLIAAAPDLLAALIGAEQCIAQSLTHLPPDTLGVFVGEWLGEIRETIAKATGGGE